MLCPTALRVWTPGRKKRRRRRKPKHAFEGRPLSNELIVLDILTLRGFAQAFVVGAFLKVVDGIVVAEGLIHSDTATASEKPALRRFAHGRVARLNPGIVHSDVGNELLVVSLRQFHNDYLYESGYLGMGLVCGTELPFVLSRTAAHVATSERRPGSFKLSQLGRPGWDREWHDFNGAPAIWVEPRGEAWQLRFESQQVGAMTTLRTGEKVPAVAWTESGKQYKGRFEDLTQASGALFRKPRRLAALATLLGIGGVPPGREIKGEWPTDSELDGLRARTWATFQCRERLASIIAEVHRDAHVELHELRSPATIGAGYLRASGIPAAPKISDWLQAVGAEAFKGAWVGAIDVRRELQGVIHADRSKAYADDAAKLLEGLAFCERLTWRRATAALHQLLKRDPLRLASSAPACRKLARIFVEVVPDGETRCMRPYLSDRTAPSLHVGPYWSDAPVWVSAFELLDEVIASGRLPRTLRAIELVPHGRRVRHDVRFAGGPTTRGNLFAATLSVPDFGDDELGRAIEAGCKVARQSIVFGLWAQMNRVAGSWVRQLVVTPRGRFFAEGAEEFPGTYTCLPLAAALTAYGRLQLRLVHHDAAGLGWRVVAWDTDSVSLVPADEGAAPVERVLEVLRSESGWRVKHGSDAEPVSLLAIVNKRTALLRRATDGAIQLLDASEHVLGGRYAAPDGDESVGDSGARRWVERQWLHYLDPLCYPELPEGIPAVRRVAIDRPKRWHQYRDFGIRPFGEILQAEVASLWGTPPGPIAPRTDNPQEIAQWFDARTLAPVRVSLEGAVTRGEATSLVVIAELRGVCRRWWETIDERVSQNETAGQDTCLPVGELIQRGVRSTSSLTYLIGRESSVWAEGFAGVIAPDDPSWLTTFGTRTEPTDVLRRAVARITPAIVAEEAGCAENSAVSFRDATRSTSEQVVARIRDVCFAHALAALGRGSGPRMRRQGASERSQLALIALWLESPAEGRICEWGPCTEVPPPNARFCKDAHRKAHARKQRREWLASKGLVECPNPSCRALRSGDTRGRCDVCRGARAARSVRCKGCGVRWTGSIPDPCPICERDQEKDAQDDH